MLQTPVRDFVDAVAGALAHLAPDQDVPALRNDAVVEAYDLVCAFIDSDGLHTDEELWALIGAFALLMDTQLHRATPHDVRAAGLVTGKRAWLDKPSLLFDTLLRADRSGGTNGSWTYYVHAMRLAHHVASLDTVTQHAELQALERFRSTLLAALKEASVGRQPRAATAAGPRSAVTAAPVQAAGAPPEEEPLPPPRPLEELLAELDALVGLDAVKAEVKLVANLLQVQALRRKRGLKAPEQSRHLVFTGNPGTGKTTVARLLAQIYRTLQVVERGHLVETDRSQLVAGFVGQTATKVVEVFDRANGGVLLIDEAYSLVRGGERDFGREAIDTIVKLVEDRRDDLVVIMAGYPDEMAALLDTNPGMRSRFPRTIHFPDYTTDELLRIIELQAEAAEYRLDDAARAKAARVLDAVERGRGFGNGRLARNLFEQAVARQASRIVALGEPTDEQLVTLVEADIPDAAATPPSAPGGRTAVDGASGADAVNALR